MYMYFTLALLAKLHVYIKTCKCANKIDITNQTNGNQGCHRQGKHLENEFFPGQGKIREFYDLSGTGKFEKSGNLKKMWLGQSSGS